VLLIAAIAAREITPHARERSGMNNLSAAGERQES
jgi:hypothetical protein